MELHNLKKLKRDRNKKKRIGRGMGSGKGGHTVGFGMKGQKSRRGNSIPTGFEGGQVPLFKKLPKKPGFKNHNPKRIIAVPLVKLNKFKDGDTVTPDSLVKAKIINKVPKHGVKILSNGILAKKLKLEGFLYTKQATEKITKSGSEIV